MDDFITVSYGDSQDILRKSVEELQAKANDAREIQEKTQV